MFTDKTSRAIDLIWKSFDSEKIQAGYRLAQEAAEEGDPDALCVLGRCHLGSDYLWEEAGIDDDPVRASKLIKESVLAGSAIGVLTAMRCGELTPGVKRRMPFASEKEAFAKVHLEAQSGNGFCLFMIGNALFWGDYLTFEPEASKQFNSPEEYYAFAYPLAAEYYKNAFDKGILYGFGNFRTICESEYGNIPEPAFEAYFKLVADNGNPLVCNDYGKYLQDEYEGCDEEAFSYYMKAFEFGDLMSAYNVGVSYDYGMGVEEDLDKAFEYYRIAAEAGWPSAQFQLGDFYFEGRGNIARDYAKAFKWLKCAYDNSNEDNCWRPAAELSILYQDGLGTIRDYDMAFEMLSVVEDVIDDVWEPLDAMVLNALGVAYGFGLGTDADIDKGIEYLDRAIEFGSEAAKANKARLLDSVS